MTFSPRGDRLASASKDGLVILWDAHALARPAAAAAAADGARRLELAGHTDAPHALAWSPDGVMLLSASADHTVRLWAAGGERAGECLRVFEGHTEAVMTVARRARGDAFLSSGLDKTLCLCAVDRPAAAHTWHVPRLTDLLVRPRAAAAPRRKPPRRPASVRARRAGGARRGRRRAPR